MNGSTTLSPSVRLAGINGWIIAMTLLLPFAVYFGTAHGIVSIWNRSETFAHGYIILPISLWLIWQQRDALVKMPVAPYWPALPALALCGFGWLLAQLGDVTIVSQYAFAAMLPLTALAVLGMPIARSIAFALLFILFAVPFGEIFVEPLIGVTANFAVDALRLTGIPVLREGNNFSIPSGNWSVVDACSGVRYLISSVTLGTLYAYLTYRSRRRQLLFVLLSVLVPIVANGMRAYLIVMIGHLSGMTMAVGFDHLIYGWVFFGFVMFLLFWIGSFWREDRLPAPSARAPVAPVPPAPPASPALLCAAALGVALCIGIWPLWAQQLERKQANLAHAELSGFTPAWQPAAPFADWTPGFLPANADLRQFWARDGQSVGLTVLYYRNQDSGSKLISSSNRVLNPKQPNWRSIGAAARTEAIGTRQLALRESVLAGDTGNIVVWQWYWIDGRSTASDYAGKFLQVKERILGGRDDGAALMVFAPYEGKPEQARAAMRAFLAANLGPLEATLAANRGH